MNLANLDEKGLAHLWNKIKNYVDSKISATGGSIIAISDVECKTNETFFGKPVYMKSFRFTDTIVASSQLAVPHKITNISEAWVDLSNSFIKSDNPLSYTQPIVSPMYYSNAGTGNNIYAAVDKSNIMLFADGDWDSAWTKVVTIRYTKTTD